MSHRGAMIFTTRRIHEALVLLLLVLAAPGRIAAMSVQAHTPGLSELRGPAAVGSSARAGAPGGPSTEESSAMSLHRLRRSRSQKQHSFRLGCRSCLPFMTKTQTATLTQLS